MDAVCPSTPAPRGCLTHTSEHHPGDAIRTLNPAPWEAPPARVSEHHPGDTVPPSTPAPCYVILPPTSLKPGHSCWCAEDLSKYLSH